MPVFPVNGASLAGFFADSGLPDVTPRVAAATYVPADLRGKPRVAAAPLLLVWGVRGLFHSPGKVR